MLKAKIISVDDGHGNMVKYFHLADEAILEKLNNVKFLSVESSNKEEHDFWVSLLEHEFTLAINPENGPLWRLIFIRSKQDIEATYRYNLILIANHAILDGRNAFI